MSKARIVPSKLADTKAASPTRKTSAVTRAECCVKVIEHAPDGKFQTLRDPEVDPVTSTEPSEVKLDVDATDNVLVL
jgi:hypothetical protein|tara:strand:+ start:170 stop:400 length:231 start_codon:yes stop_codon:yes gene_type:complete